MIELDMIMHSLSISLLFSITKDFGLKIFQSIWEF